jgi:uncharacterized protein (TIGR00299 family) protein
LIQIFIFEVRAAPALYLNGEDVRHLHFDCFSGISGDMTLGALLDAGASETVLREGLALLSLPESFELKTWKEPRHAIVGTRVGVLVGGHDADEVASGVHDHSHSHDHSHEHSHDHTHEHHEHKQDHKHDNSHHPYKKIKAQILGSKLGDDVKVLALKIFQKLAIAEGKLHGQDPEEVEFHEVGAVDSIVDIVGAAILIRYINPVSVSASPLPMGHGFIKCRHGRMPIPAPATLEILRGIPVYDAGTRGELVTPTGAAIIAAVATSFSRFLTITPQHIGYGMGKNDFVERPNALRVIIGEID